MHDGNLRFKIFISVNTFIRMIIDAMIIKFCLKYLLFINDSKQISSFR